MAMGVFVRQSIVCVCVYWCVAPPYCMHVLNLPVLEPKLCCCLEGRNLASNNTISAGVLRNFQTGLLCPELQCLVTWQLKFLFLSLLLLLLFVFFSAFWLFVRCCLSIYTVFRQKKNTHTHTQCETCWSIMSKASYTRKRKNNSIGLITWQWH